MDYICNYFVSDRITDKCVDNLNECEDDEDFPLTRERLDSVSNVEKDAMDEYLGMLSQEIIFLCQIFKCVL